MFPLQHRPRLGNEQIGSVPIRTDPHSFRDFLVALKHNGSAATIWNNLGVSYLETGYWTGSRFTATKRLTWTGPQPRRGINLPGLGNRPPPFYIQPAFPQNPWSCNPQPMAVDIHSGP